MAHEFSNFTCDMPDIIEKDKNSKNIFHKILLHLFYIFISGLVLTIFVAYPTLEGHKFGDIIYSRDERPFVYRTLMPLAVSTVAKITPDFLAEWVTNKAEARNFTQQLIESSDIEDGYIYEYFVALALILGCFYGFIIFMRKLIGIFYEFPDYAANNLSFIALLLTPLLGKYSSHVYDPPILLLFSASLLFIMRRNLLLYYIAFLLASLNKETSLLLIGVFLAKEYKSMNTRTLLIHIVAQLLIWGIVKAGIMFIFKDNPGTVIWFPLFYHNLQLIYHLPSLLFVVAVFAVFYFLIKYRWHEKPLILKRSLFITLIPTFILSIFFGYFDELRIYYEVYIFAFMLSVPTIALIFKMPETARQ